MHVYMLEAEHRYLPGRMVFMFATRKLAEAERRRLRKSFRSQLEYVEITRHEIMEG